MTTAPDTNDGSQYSLSGEIVDAKNVPGAQSSNLSQRAISGVVWLTIQKWAIRLVGFITIAVLTRLLSPEDFGAVAAATTVLPFFYLLADFGFAAYIVQADKADQRLLSTGFWFSSVSGILLSGTLVIIAPLFGVVYDSAQTVPILQVLSISALVTALGSVPGAILRRSMKFRTIAAQGTVGALVGQAVGVVMAIAGAGAWALVGQTLASGVIGCALAWVSAKWHPSLVFSLSDFVLMARFGFQVLGVEFVAVLRAWAEAAIVSTTLGIAALGYLSVAQRLVLIVQELTGGAIIPVSTVAFAKLRGSSERVTSAYLRALKLTYAILSLPLVVVAVASPTIVPLIFGDGWLVSSNLAQILALAGMLTVGAALDHGLFYGLGRPGVWFVYAVLVDAATVAATATAVNWSLTVLAWAFLGVALLATVARWFLVAHLLRTQLLNVVRPFNFLSLIVVASGGAGLLVVSLTNGLPPIAALALVGVAVTAVHLAVVRVLAPDIVSELSKILDISRRLDKIRQAHRR